MTNEAASGAAKAPAATLVIFGAMGDLARRLLAPAIVNLAEAGLLDEGTSLLGISHHDGDDATLADALAEFVEDKSVWGRVASQVHYMKGDFADEATFAALAGRLDGNVVFYLATAPSFFAPVVEALGRAGLLNEEGGFRRVVVEKPFGHDLASARELNRRLLACAGEAQIFRIDHFLGKETVQNIMIARFGNLLLEAVWNNRYVDHVQITAAETVTVGSRGKFYDATGALRDMVPNHLFQLLAMIGMEPPNGLDAEAIRTEKAKLIAAVRPIPPEDAVRGRYAAGRIGETEVQDYRREADVAADGRTETYAALKLMVDTWRWAGVPFYLRTGKALSHRDTEIVVQFRPVPVAMFGAVPPNRLVLQIQPSEGLSLDMVAKVPGPELETAPVALTFSYADRFPVGHRTGYETLLYDVLTGDQTLFQRADQIEGAWAAVQPVLDAWAEGQPEDYVAGGAGPEAADRLMAQDGRAWHALG